MLFSNSCPSQQVLSYNVSMHGIAMPKGDAKGIIFYRCGFFIFYFFFSTPNLWRHWMDLNQTWIHIDLWLLGPFENFGPNSPGIYPHGLGAKNPLFGTDFELWPNISLQWNMISTNRKKLVNLQGHPYTCHPNLNFGPETAEKGWRVIAHPLNFRIGWHCQPIEWALYNRQQAYFGTCYVLAPAYSPEQQNAGRAQAALCHASSFFSRDLEFWPLTDKRPWALNLT